MRTRHVTLLMVGIAALLGACGNPKADAAPLPGGPSPTATAAASRSADVTPSGCPVTQPPDPAFEPPTHYAALQGEFWYGSPALWTSLRMDGKWWALPHDGGGYSQKVFFWREGYDIQVEQQPDLTITGRRLDGAAPPLISSAHGTNAYNAEIGQAMLNGVEVPTLGCWEITGSYHGRSLSFVVRVAP